MKQLAVLVEKSKLGDIPKFQNFLTSILYDESSCRGHLGVHSSSLIFFKLIRLIYLYMWLSNTFISCLFSILWFSRRFTRSLQIFRPLLFQPPSNLVCFGKHFSCTCAVSSSLDPRQVRLQASKSFTGPKTL